MSKDTAFRIMAFKEDGTPYYMFWSTWHGTEVTVEDNCITIGSPPLELVKGKRPILMAYAQEIAEGVPA